MRKIRTIFRAQILAISILICGNAASACGTERARVWDDINSADVVFTGIPIDYEMIIRENYRRYALITYTVIETLKGEESDSMQLVWKNSSFTMPDDLDRTSQVIVAAISKDNPAFFPQHPKFVDFQIIPPDSILPPDMMIVLQAHCAPAFIFPYNSDMMLRVKNALSGHPIDEGIPKRCYRWKRINGKQIKTEYPCPEE